MCDDERSCMDAGAEAAGRVRSMLVRSGKMTNSIAYPVKVMVPSA